MIKKQRKNKRRILPPEQREKMILKAALDIFSNSGYDAADVEKIAKKANVGKGTIYRYFPSKLILFRALIDDGMQSLCVRMKVGAEKSRSFDQRIKWGITNYIEFFVENPKFYRLLLVEYSRDYQKNAEEYLKRHQQYMTPLINVIEDGIKSGQLKKIDPEFAAYCLMAISWIVIDKQMLTKANTRNKDIDNAVSLFLEGVKKKK